MKQMSDLTEKLVKALFVSAIVLPYSVKIKRDEEKKPEKISLKAFLWKLDYDRDADEDNRIKLKLF